MSKLARAAMMVTVRQTPISWRRLGRVTAKNSRTGPAPSRRAASYSAGSILLIPVTSRIVQRPSSTQAPMTPTAGSAVSKSPSQARATPPRPTARSTWLTRPFDDSSQLHAMPAATRGMTWGRNSTVRTTVPNAPVVIRRTRLATSRPSATGTKLKKTIRTSALPMIFRRSPSVNTVR